MYFFVGIKGAGMSSLASIMHDLGYKVEGSDIDKHFFTEKSLDERNIKYYSYNKDNIKNGMIIIKGASIKDSHEEIVRARELGLEIVTYEEMVGRISREFKTICICGCHGKTTTTALMSIAFDNINYLIGDGTGYATRENEFFALESCEYKRHFLNYLPYYTVITNIDLDHVDYYKDIDDVIDAFQEFANKSVNKVVAYGEDENIKKMKLEKDIIYFGLDEKDDIYASNINYSIEGISFDVYAYKKFYGNFKLPLYGKHQLLDALAVICVCFLEGMDAKKVNDNLSNFHGARRRFSEEVVNDSIIIDDYAHHPNEVRATIDAIKQKYPDKKIVCILQPHTYSRTREFADEFVKILNDVDASYILDIHPAREKQEDYPGVTSDIIINKLNNGFPITKDDASSLVKHKGSVYLFMDPNDISSLENDLKEKLNKEA